MYVPDLDVTAQEYTDAMTLSGTKVEGFTRLDADLDKIFRPLENSRTSEMLLGKEKARLRNTPRHASWLRIYAIKLEPGIYIITGGAIKLTRTMQEREHTLVELARMEKVRRFLLDNDIADKDSFMDFLNEII